MLFVSYYPFSDGIEFCGFGSDDNDPCNAPSNFLGQFPNADLDRAFDTPAEEYACGGSIIQPLSCHTAMWEAEDTGGVVFTQYGEMECSLATRCVQFYGIEADGDVTGRMGCDEPTSELTGGLCGAYPLSENPGCQASAESLVQNGLTEGAILCTDSNPGLTTESELLARLRALERECDTENQPPSGNSYD